MPPLPPSTDTASKDFLASLYCIYFTSWKMIVRFLYSLCMFCVYIFISLVVYFPTIGKRQFVLYPQHRSGQESVVESTQLADWPSGYWP